MNHQEELQLRGVFSHDVFPGAILLRVEEVADVLRCTKYHIYRLIEDSGQIVAIDIGTKQNVVVGSPDKSRRACYRIPVSAYDDFVKASSTTNNTLTK